MGSEESMLSNLESDDDLEEDKYHSAPEDSEETDHSEDESARTTNQELENKFKQWLDEEDRDGREFTLLSASAFMDPLGDYEDHELRELKRETMLEKIREFLKSSGYKFRPAGDFSFRVEFNRN